MPAQFKTTIFGSIYNTIYNCARFKDISLNANIAGTTSKEYFSGNRINVCGEVEKATSSSDSDDRFWLIAKLYDSTGKRVLKID